MPVRRLISNAPKIWQDKLFTYVSYLVDLRDDGTDQTLVLKNTQSLARAEYHDCGATW